MLDLLSGFVAELRRAGLPVSLTEHLDAAEAVRHIPLEDREGLKYTLAATLVKSSSHWRAFETAFEVFFAVRTGAARPPGRQGRGRGVGEDAEGEQSGAGRTAGPGTRLEGRRCRRGHDARGAGRAALQVADVRRHRDDERGRPQRGRPVRGDGAGTTGGRDVLPLPHAAQSRSRCRPRAADGPGPGRCRRRVPDRAGGAPGRRRVQVADGQVPPGGRDGDPAPPGGGPRRGGAGPLGAQAPARGHRRHARHPGGAGRAAPRAPAAVAQAGGAPGPQTPARPQGTRSTSGRPCVDRSPPVACPSSPGSATRARPSPRSS